LPVENQRLAVVDLRRCVENARYVVGIPLFVFTPRNISTVGVRGTGAAGIPRRTALIIADVNNQIAGLFFGTLVINVDGYAAYRDRTCREVVGEICAEVLLVGDAVALVGEALCCRIAVPVI